MADAIEVTAKSYDSPNSGSTEQKGIRLTEAFNADHACNELCEIKGCPLPHVDNETFLGSKYQEEFIKALRDPDNVDTPCFELETACRRRDDAGRAAAVLASIQERREQEATDAEQVFAEQAERVAQIPARLEAARLKRASDANERDTYGNWLRDN